MTVTPRPDLQVSEIDIPQRVDAGGTFSVAYTLINQGGAATTSNWVDRVYLSLTPSITPDSILIQQLSNQTALGIDASDNAYKATTVPVVVPLRFRGTVYVIVDADANHQVDQWPNGAHDLEYKALVVAPLPLPDLVVSNVVAPDAGHRGYHVQRHLHRHQPRRRRDPGRYLDRLRLADARQDAADPGQGRHPPDRAPALRHAGRQGRLRPDRDASRCPRTSTPASTT